MRLKRKRLLPAFLAVAALLALSVAAAMTRSLPLYLLLALSVPAAIKSVPAFKGRESLALFIVVTVVGLPINLAAVCALMERFIEDPDTPLLTQVLWGTVLCSCAASIENIVIGVVGRLLWPKQVEIEL